MPKRTVFKVPIEEAEQQDTAIKAEGVISSPKEHLIGLDPMFVEGMSNEDASLAFCSYAIKKWANGEYLKDAESIALHIKKWILTREEIKRQIRG